MSLRFPQGHHKITQKQIEKLALEKSRAVVLSLKKAYESRPKDLPDEEEKKILEIMAHAKKLQKELEKIFKKS